MFPVQSTLQFALEVPEIRSRKLEGSAVFLVINQGCVWKEVWSLEMKVIELPLGFESVFRQELLQIERPNSPLVLGEQVSKG